MVPFKFNNISEEMVLTIDAVTFKRVDSTDSSSSKDSQNVLDLTKLEDSSAVTEEERAGFVSALKNAVLHPIEFVVALTFIRKINTKH